MQNKFRSPWAYILVLFVLLAGLLMLPNPASSQTATPSAATTATSTAATTATALNTSTVLNTPTAMNTPTALSTSTPTASITRTPITRTPVSPTVGPGTGSQQLRSVSVSGSGSVNGVPDQAVIVLGVRTEDENAAQALTLNNTQMQALITALRAAGVAQADIRTLTVQLQPRYQPPPTSRAEDMPTVDGFIAINTVEVTVRDLDNLGELLDSAIAAGGNQIEGIRFEFADPAALLDQARQAAMEDAQHKAEQLSQLAGARLGVVLTISESSVTPFPSMRDLAQANVGGQVPISPGTQAVQVDIQVTWELQ